jgi:rhodanese-related sulfurtransferase
VALRLRELGYRDAFALQGGYDAWKSAGNPVEPLTPEDAATTTPP